LLGDDGFHHLAYRGAVDHVAQLCADVPAVLTPLLFILARNVGGEVLSNLRRPGVMISL
jgi:hypothetical protein